jgi:UTP--glucose-1-phosphate uridylyltransferase
MFMKQLTKAVIAAAGYDTRMLPITKAVSKEMLPLVDKPVIQYIVEKLAEAGIEDIIMVVSAHKSDLAAYFGDTDQGLVEHLRAGGPTKEAILNQLEAVRGLASFAFIEQSKAYGTGVPVLDAAPYIGDEPFVFVFADDFFIGSNSYKQLVQTYEQYQAPVIACTRRVEAGDYNRYGYVGGDMLASDVIAVRAIVEHPGKEHAPSDLASVDGFVVTPDVLTYLRRVRENLPVGKELYFNAALDVMLKEGKQVIAKEIIGADFFDTGTKLDYMKTVVAVAANHPEIGEQFKQYLTVFTRKEQ